MAGTQQTGRLPIYSDAAPGLPFALEELEIAVAALHNNKSVAQPFLPGIIWKSAPNAVARYLFQHLSHWWSYIPPIIPQNWKDSWLFFLPKPGKKNNHPDQLRPISLMEPMGKLVMGLLAAKIRDHVFPHFVSNPTIWIYAIPSCNRRHPVCSHPQPMHPHPCQIPAQNCIHSGDSPPGTYHLWRNITLSGLDKGVRQC